jgi:hypothetical protein
MATTNRCREAFRLLEDPFRVAAVGQKQHVDVSRPAVSSSLVSRAR